jgi:hypothetical protein
LATSIENFDDQHLEDEKLDLDFEEDEFEEED